MAQIMNARRIIISCDGTWNDSSSKQPYTNVILFQSLLASNDTRSNGVRYEQIPYYVDGIGTNQSWLKKITEGALGTAYTGEQDQIVLTGFSRGAFTVQCIAQLINDFGLLQSRYLNQELPLVYELWTKVTNPQSAALLKKYVDQLKWDNKLHKTKDDTIKIPIDVYAVWDTVKSVAWWTGFRPMDEKLPPNVKHAYHALALDERRNDFYPQILEPTSPTTELKQVWFSGSHSDIGGGNAKVHGLSAIALQWMYIQCKQHMQFIDNAEHKISEAPLVQNIDNDHEAIKARVTNYDSYGLKWRIRGTKSREVGTKPQYEKVHESVKYITSQYEFPSRLLELCDAPPPPADEYHSIQWDWRLRSNGASVPQEYFTPQELQVFEGWIMRDRRPRVAEGPREGIQSDKYEWKIEWPDVEETPVQGVNKSINDLD